MLDRSLHHGHVLKFGPRSWRTKTELPAAALDDPKENLEAKGISCAGY
jgi:hypothetical protein